MLALFWNEHLRDEYPVPTDAEPIDPQVERFEEGLLQKLRPMLRFGPFPGARLQMASKDKHWMVQAQNGRIVFNWRKLEGGDYPRWRNTRPRFAEVYQKLKQFVQDHELGSIQPDQWEVTYANHLVKGVDWQAPEEWHDLVPGVLGRPQAVEGLRLERAVGAQHLEIEPQRGRLHVELEQGVRRVADKEEQILVLQLTARGGLGLGDDASLIAELDSARSLIVRTFLQVTGEKAQERWGKHYAE
jgi:uncharacterized protein (TIGR04255 family)